MNRYECLLCGEIYDPEMGDFEGAIEPGVPFEALPDDWCCPECGAPWQDFIELEDLATTTRRLLFDPALKSGVG
ncbi:MAG TPA: rubredoxin [Methanomicrobia archaeon]|nr:rubredoxin [Methanomicrobia archaeon]